MGMQCGQGQQHEVHAGEHPVARAQAGQEAAIRGQRVDHGQQGQGGGAGPQQLDPGPLGGPTHRPEQGGPPGDEHGVHLPLGALRHLHRQQAIGPEHAGHADGQAGDGGDVQPFHEPEAEMRPFRVGQLAAPLHVPQHQSRSHHGRARKADDEVQPARGQVAEAAHVQRIEHAARLGGGAHAVLCLQQLAADAVEHHELRADGDAAVLAADGGHARIGIAGQVDVQALHLARAPALLGLADHVGQRCQGRGLARGLACGNKGTELLAGHHALLGRHGRGQIGPGHVHQGQGHQAGVRDHQVKGQAQHGQRVVRVQPGALPLAPAEGEEVGKDLLVRDHSADDGHQHEHGAQPRQIAAPEHGHVVELEVEAVEELAAARLAHRAFEARAGGRVEAAVLEAALALAFGRAPEHRGHRAAFIGQVDQPPRALRCQARHGVTHTLGHQRGLARLALVRLLGLHPLRDLVPEIAHRAREEHGVEEPAQQQADPGVQVGHGLADARRLGGFPGLGGLAGRVRGVRVHAPSPLPQVHHAAGASTRAATSRPAQARVALRTANTQITAPA